LTINTFVQYEKLDLHGNVITNQEKEPKSNKKSEKIVSDVTSDASSSSDTDGEEEEKTSNSDI